MKQRDEALKLQKHIPNKQKHIFLDLVDLETSQSKCYYVKAVLEPIFKDKKQAKTPKTKVTNPKLVKYPNKGKMVYRYG
jgi:UDP-2,3-diacylglucosamine pyrophosphatase LpxH